MSSKHIYRRYGALKSWNFLTCRQPWCLQGKMTISKNCATKNTLHISPSISLSPSIPLLSIYLPTYPSMYIYIYMYMSHIYIYIYIYIYLYVTHRYTCMYIYIHEMWHWTNNEIGVAVQSCPRVQVELMAWWLSPLGHLNEIQWSWVQIPLTSTFYSYFKESVNAEYHMYQLILLHSCDYLHKTSIKINVVTDEGKHPKWNVTLNK